ncbi:MBL fold metallo-hydrolase [bacterium]|nr:MBL fold metallo-hydrolase [bacterium]
MTTVIFNGTGSSTGVPQLFCNCDVCRLMDERNRRTRFSMTLIEGETVLQIDFPYEIRQQLLKSRIPHIDAGWLTHAHSDHFAGIDDLRMASFRNDEPLPFFLSRETFEIATRRFPYLFFENEYLPRPFLKPVFVEKEPVSFRNLTILPIRHKHGETVVTSLRFKDFALLADINSIDSCELDKAKGAKILAISSTVQKKHPTHFSFEEILDIIRYLAPERAYLTHMNHTFDYEETLKKLPENVLPAIDGLKVEI